MPLAARTVSRKYYSEICAWKEYSKSIEILLRLCKPMLSHQSMLSSPLPFPTIEAAVAGSNYNGQGKYTPRHHPSGIGYRDHPNQTLMLPVAPIYHCQRNSELDFEHSLSSYLYETMITSKRTTLYVCGRSGEGLHHPPPSPPPKVPIIMSWKPL